MIYTCDESTYTITVWGHQDKTLKGLAETINTAHLRNAVGNDSCDTLAEAKAYRELFPLLLKTDIKQTVNADGDMMLFVQARDRASMDAIIEILENNGVTKANGAQNKSENGTANHKKKRA